MGQVHKRPLGTCITPQPHPRLLVKHSQQIGTLCSFLLRQSRLPLVNPHTMATPTASKHGPGQVVATPPVSTPFSASNHHSHPAFSPHGPRSVVPSPQQVKKSPANSNTMYGYPGGGHPTNSLFGVGYDSPSAAMALGGVPGLELGLDGMVVPGSMGTPLGGVSVGHLGGARGDEDERRRRLGQVMDILKVCGFGA